MIRNFFRFIFSTFFWICAFIGVLIFALVLILYLGHIGPFAPSLKSLKRDSILSLTLNGSYVEHANSKGIESLFLGRNASLYDLTHAILKASQDEKIKGILVRIESPSLGMAQLQELRDALLSFRKSGKPSWCYSDTFGESSSGTGLYYLATACEEIWIQPVGTLNLVGINMETPFAKGAIDKLDIKPEIAQRKEYKTFPEMFTRDDYSEDNREASQAIADSVLGQIVEGIAKERKISHDRVRLLIASGPYLTQEALTEKLIDRIDYRNALASAIREKLGHHISFVGIGPYLYTKPHEAKGNKIALIFGSGVIQRDGKSSVLDELMISSNATYRAFQLAIDDKDVKAIVYRISSSGGSPIAAETIYSIINYAREHAKKPVIISMSDTAASGGYWIAVAGSKIVAQPATLTGSIGVFGGKYVLSGLLEKLGVKVGRVSTSENATMWSFTEPFTPAQWSKLNAIMDEIYEAFSSRVAKGRKMTRDQVEKVARGRVWTGEQALALGLVDQLGGFQSAIDLAKQEAGLAHDAGVEIYPRRKTFLENLVTLFEHDEEGSSHEAGVLGTFLQPFKKIMAVFRFIQSSEEILYVPLGEVK
ncbi:MAG: signal peptide peptidase SppA [Alphaproteobacteria bacterium 41-28]|nr:MAG: signal peptide peptidase SppA [Alphaproteobacteria bacterium 41-28]